MSKPIDWHAVAWVMYDMTVNRLPRYDSYKALLTLGMTRREAAEKYNHTKRNQANENR